MAKLNVGQTNANVITAFKAALAAVRTDIAQTFTDAQKSQARTNIGASSVNDTNTLQSNVAVLESRMDEFASLTEGSTTGDAELQDIRVGYNGLTYSTAGNAVRAQIDEIDDKYKPYADAGLKAIYRYNNTNAVYCILPVVVGKKYAIKVTAHAAFASIVKLGGSTSNATSGLFYILAENFSMAAEDTLWFYNYTPSSASVQYLYWQGATGTVPTNWEMTLYEYCENIVNSDKEACLNPENAEFIDSKLVNLFDGYVPRGQIFWNNGTGASATNSSFFSYEDVAIPDDVKTIFPYNAFAPANNYYYIRSICFYNSSGTFISGVSGNASTVANGVPVPTGAVKLNASLNFNSNKIAEHYLSTKQGNVNDYTLKDEIKVYDNNIRKAVINFQFDDGDANDASIVAIFDSYGVKCGFALPTNISSSRFPDYLGYQDKGYEIMSHSTDGTGMNDATVAPATIETKLKTSKETLEGYGFKVNGFVTPSSNMAEVFRPLLRKYYQWAETIYYGGYTGSYSGSRAPFMKPYDGCYNGWRVSLQTTTLENQKAAVDACVAKGGILTFYGHAASLDTTDYLTTANLQALLYYILLHYSGTAASTYNDGIIKTPSEAKRLFFNARNEDIATDWVSVAATDVNLDSRLSVDGWDMRYSPSLKLFSLTARLKATEAIAGAFYICDIPVTTFGQGTLVLSEASGATMLYNGYLYKTHTGTWAANTSYRFHVVCPYMFEK